MKEDLRHKREQSFFTGLKIQKEASQLSLSLFPWENPEHCMYSFRRLSKKKLKKLKTEH